MLIALNSRNQRLAKFWLTDQSGAPPAPTLAGRTIAILHGEDDFVNMLAHVFSVLGMGSTVIRHEDFEPGVPSTTSTSSWSAPGRATRATTTHPKIAAYRAGDRRPARRRASPSWRSAWATRCCATGSGFRWPTRTSSSRAPSRRSRSTAARSAVGFYNTFVGAGRRTDCPTGVSVEADPATGDIHLVAGPHYRGVQFHAESILTENGFALLRGLLLELLAPRWLNLPGCSWSTTTTPTPGTSSTWSPRSPVSCPRCVEHDDARGARRPAPATRHIVLSPGPGHPADAPTSPSGAAVFELGVPVLGVCLGMQALVTSYGGTVAGSSRPTARSRRSTTTGAASSRGPADAVRGGALPLPGRALDVPDELRGRRDRGDGVVMAVRAPRAAAARACSSTPSRSCREHGAELVAELPGATVSAAGARGRAGGFRRAATGCFWLDGGGSRDWSGRRSLVGVLDDDDVSLTFDAARREVVEHRAAGPRSSATTSSPCCERDRSRRR